MSDFALKVDFIAEMSDFDSALQKMERDMDEVAKEVESAANEMGEGVAEGAEEGASGMMKMAETAAKVIAAMAAFEMAAGLAGAATALFSGNTEQLRTSLGGLPIIGGLISKMYEFGDAMEYAGVEAVKERRRILDLDFAMQDLSATILRITDEIARTEQMMTLQGATELEIAVATYAKKNELLQKEHADRLAAIDAENEARIAAIKEQNLGEEESDRLYQESWDRRKAAIAEEKEALEERRQILALELDAAKTDADEVAEAEAAAAAEAADAEERAAREAHRLRMEQEAEWLAEQMSGAEAAKRARLKAIEEERVAREAAAQEALALDQRRADAQAEIDAARAEAEAAVRGATGTFATAGGSFTTGVQAQVDQSKVLAKISEQSRDFLAQIVQNTALLGGFGFA